MFVHHVNIDTMAVIIMISLPGSQHVYSFPLSHKILDLLVEPRRPIASVNSTKLQGTTDHVSQIDNSH